MGVTVLLGEESEATFGYTASEFASESHVYHL